MTQNPRRIAAAAAVVLVAFAAVFTQLPGGLSALDSGCQGSGAAAPDLLLCDDFEQPNAVARWDVGSRGGAWPSTSFVRCGDGIGFGDRCAAWSNHLLFDRSWGFWGYDAWRPIAPKRELYIRWYQYVSDPYAWGGLEDKSVLLHDEDTTLTAYVGTSRNHLPAERNSGPGMPFVANYQDLDWDETGQRFTRVNRFQNQGNNITLQPGRWYLFEWHVRLNTAGAADGSTRLWIDDASRPIARQTLRMHYDDMRWLRDGDAGKHFDFLRLTVYNQRCDAEPNRCPPNGPAKLAQFHRWDRIVVSTRPVGPMGAARHDYGARQPM